jgi:hypothetical protein
MMDTPADRITRTMEKPCCLKEGVKLRFCSLSATRQDHHQYVHERSCGIGRRCQYCFDEQQRTFWVDRSPAVFQDRQSGLVIPVMNNALQYVRVRT